jgi:putative NADH-flavin reductase
MPRLFQGSPMNSHKKVYKSFTMQITILGAAGRIGQEVVRQALKAGYQVKVLVRNPDKMGELKDKVDIVKGNLLDPLSVEEAMNGSKAVINLSGAAKEPDQVLKFQEIGKILVQKLKELRISRLINISAAVAILPGEKLEFKRRVLRFITYLFYKEMKEVQDTVMEIILKEKDIDWTLIRPAFITDKNGSKNVLINDKRLPGLTVTLQDLGKFTVDQVSSSEWIRKAPMITSV